jgi:hypothetical protein
MVLITSVFDILLLCACAPVRRYINLFPMHLVTMDLLHTIELISMNLRHRLAYCGVHAPNADRQWLFLDVNEANEVGEGFLGLLHWLRCDGSRATQLRFKVFTRTTPCRDCKFMVRIQLHRRPFLLHHLVSGQCPPTLSLSD